MNRTIPFTRVFTLAVVSVLLVFLSGCAGTSKASESESAEAKNFTAPSGKGSVFLYRTGRAVGAAGQLKVKVNSQDAGGTGPGTFFRWDLSPGTYTFSSFTDESSAVIKIEVKADEVYYIRQDARMGINNGRVTMKKVESDKGQKEVERCQLLVSSYLPE